MVERKERNRRMTKEEAIRIQKWLHNNTFLFTSTENDVKQSTEMAITALSQEPQSEWERDHEVLKAYADGQDSMKSCEDAISRQEVLNIIEFEDKWLVDAKSHNTNTTIAFDSMISKVQALPSVSTEKTGHWIAQDIHNCHTDFRCSKCGYIHSFMHLYGEPTADYTYCPNCGAKMEVEE